LGPRLHPAPLLLGTVLVNDGVKRRIDYSVREESRHHRDRLRHGLCIVGLDRHYAHAPACKQAQP
jgi:hypothetical protein